MQTTNDILTTSLLSGIHLNGSGLTSRNHVPDQEKQVFKNQNTNGREKHSACLAQDITARRRLTSLLLVCFDTLDNFGKEPEQLANMEKVFQMVLGRFTIEEVEDAFMVYLGRETVIPKPADIVKIIEPPVESKKWCGATFIDIKRRLRDGEFITDSEKKYCLEYVAARIEDPEIDKTVRKIDQQDRKYWVTER